MENKKGIILVNIGTPKTYQESDIKAYLNRFLSDQRVVALPKWKWWPILHGIILRKRPKKVSKIYQSIWQPAGSPLLIYTEKQRRLLQQKLPDSTVIIGMNYSQPYLIKALKKLEKEGIGDITIIPLFPHYSSATTAAVYDQVAVYTKNSINIPSITIIKDFYQHPLYIQILIEQIREMLSDFTPDCLLVSYHSVPTANTEAGDPYEYQCEATTKMLQELLHVDFPIQTVYQSKFGNDPWLEPNLSDELKRLPKVAQVKKVAVITPGFVADCIETLAEIEVENKAYFLAAGGEEFYYIHPFNDHPKFATLLAELVQPQSKWE